MGVNLYAADMRGSDLRGVDLRRTLCIKQVRWFNARFEKTALKHADIDPVGDELDAERGITSRVRSGDDGEYSEAMEAFAALKANFIVLGNYQGAAWAFVKERQMEKACHFPATPGKRWLIEKLGEAPNDGGATRSLLCCTGCARPGCTSACSWDWSRRTRRRSSTGRVGADLAVRAIDGLRAAPSHAYLRGFVTIVLFWIAFAAEGNVSAGPPAEPLVGSHDPVNALAHSVAALATVGFNTLEPVGWGAKLLTAVESMLGISLFALLIYTAGNRMSRS